MINKRLKQWTSGFLALLLLLMLIPAVPASVQAAGPQTIDISNLYHVSTAGGLAPADDTQVPRMTTNPISVTANITNITSSEVQTIYYIVTNMNIGNPDDEKSNKAVLSASGNEITFNNVYLTEGLNKIELVMGNTTQIKSAPAWVYFTPTTTISEFSVQGEAFTTDKIYPTIYNSSETALLLKGYAPNTKTVQAYRYGEDSFPKTVMPDNSNYFYILGDNAAKGDCQLSTQIICLKPGDNSVTFSSSNDSNYYQFIKNIIYNNGQPFPYLTRIQPTADVTANVPFTDNHLMVKEQDRTFTTKNLTVKTKLKVDVIPNPANPALAVPKYDNVDLYINNDTNTPVRLALGTTTATGTDSAWGIVSQLAYNAADSSANNYRVYDLTLTITDIPAITITSSKQTLGFHFYDTAGNQTAVDSLFNFYYNDTNASLIENVKRSTGNVTLSDSTTITNELNVLPETLVIQTNDKTSKVVLIIDGNEVGNPLTVTQDTDGLYKARVTFDTTDLTDGNHDISFMPINMDLTTENPSGSKSYKVKINTAPFVIFKQLYNGMILDSAAEIADFNSLQGQVMNYDKNGTGNSLSLYINPPTKDNLTPYLGTDNVFTYAPVAPAPSFASQIKEGKNTIKVEIRIAGVLVRTQSYEVYKFSTLAPQFQTVTPIDTGGLFVTAQTPDKYSTNEKTVSFSGVVNNSNGIVKVTVHSRDSQGNPVVETSASNTAVTLDSIYNNNYIANVSANVDGKRTFSTNPIKLPLNYNVVVEFSVTNNTNTVATRSITVVREAVPYSVKSPALIKNEDGLPQANVNSNFIDIKLEAENATSVIFGKEPALKNTTTGYFEYSMIGLKAGKNTIKFTVYRGTEKTDGSFIVYNANTTVQGASYKSKLASKLKVFNGELNLSFPKGTLLMRSEPNSSGETFMTAERYMYFGVADSNDGRVEKGVKYPAGSELALSKLTKDTIVDRFRPASKLFFIDGGTIPAMRDSTSNPQQSEDAYREDALVTGSGRDPYEPGRLSPYFFLRDPRNSVIPTQNGELTLKFDANIRDDSWKYVTVFHFDVYQEFGANRYEWKNIGGVVDMGSNTITVPISKFGYYQVMYMDKSFDDVTDHSFARNELDTLYSKGIMKGKSTFSFFPNEAITRGEFATMLVKIFDLPLNYDGEKTFIDVFTTSSLLNTLYDYKYIETAARAGIIRGTSSNRFKPDDAITRQDMAIMIARAANLKLSNDTTKSLTTLQKLFTDANGIDLYARTAVEAVTKAGLIEGIPNVMVEGQKKETLRFDPKENFTRAQAAIVAMRVLAQQKKVPK